MAQLAELQIDLEPGDREGVLLVLAEYGPQIRAWYKESDDPPDNAVRGGRA
jgi:hypothetical protein